MHADSLTLTAVSMAVVFSIKPKLDLSYSRSLALPHRLILTQVP